MEMIWQKFIKIRPAGYRGCLINKIHLQGGKEKKSTKKKNTKYSNDVRFTTPP